MVYSSFSTHLGHYCSPYKDLVGKYSENHGIRDNLMFRKRKYPCASQCFFSLRPSIIGASNHYKWHSQDKTSRSIIGRSEIAGAGSPTAAYQFSVDTFNYLNAELQVVSKVRAICFYAVTSFVAMFLFVLMLVMHPFVLLRDKYQRKFHHFIAKTWAAITVALFIKVKVQGGENLPPNNLPAVYVSNHQSFLDIYTLLTLGRSFKFISKTSIFLFPVVGWAMFLMGVIPLKRMDSRSQVQTLKRCMELVKNGGSVFFFPEGTRSKDGSLGAFKKGAFTIAAKTGVPVVPITLTGTGKIMPSGMEGILNPGSVNVVIHRPIKGNDPDELCNEARNVIADELDRQG